MCLFTDCVGVVSVFPSNCEVRMTEAVLNVKRVCPSFQEECCVGMAQRVEVEQRHSQLLVNDAVGVLQ